MHCLQPLNHKNEEIRNNYLHHQFSTSMSTASSASRALLLFRRAYSSAAAENVGKARRVAEMAGNKVECGLGKDVFWMKDPKSGDWLPETHFEQVDAAELRAILRSKNEAAASS